MLIFVNLVQWLNIKGIFLFRRKIYNSPCRHLTYNYTRWHTCIHFCLSALHNNFSLFEGISSLRLIILLFKLNILTKMCWTGSSMHSQRQQLSRRKWFFKQNAACNSRLVQVLISINIRGMMGNFQFVCISQGVFFLFL